MGKHRKPAKQKEQEADVSAAQSKSSNGKATQINGLKATAKAGSGLQTKLEPRPDWYAIDLPPIHIPDKLSQPSPKLLRTIHDHGISLLAAETNVYADTQLKSSSSHKFMSTVMQSGTWSDKVSALTLVVQESPLHTQKPFETLLGMAAKRSRDNALMALSAVKDMLAQGLMLPSDRKLRFFSKQPALIAALQNVKSTWSQADPLPNGLAEAQLIFWAYEDWLKHKYFELLQVLETWCSDAIENARTRALTYVFELLKDKPEQEENLLRLMVNKLGDRDKKIASRASHLLLQLQNFHPQMKSIIMTSIESEILLKPGQSSHAKYYAAITLNQTVLSKHDAATANTLLNIYFSVFVTILNKSKRQYELDKKKPEVIVEDGETKKRKRPGPQSINRDDKAEKELEEKIVAQVLAGIHRAFPYCKADSATFETHLDTMFRITHSSNFNTSIQALMLIQQISQSLHISTDRFMRTLYESLLDPRLLTSSKQTMYLNLLYRSLKTDASLRRVKAFVKRLLQTLTLHDPPFICAALYLVHELETTFPSIASMLSQPEMLDEDEEEVFRDVPEDREEPQPAKSQSNGSFKAHSNGYDGRKRDPDHSNADKTCLWELAPWTQHYHPSTTLFAQSLINPISSVPASKKSKPVSAFPPRPDPTTHTLVHFLDRFAYRKPKEPTNSSKDPTSTARGTSIMQPALASTNTTDTLFTRSRHGDLGVMPFNPAIGVTKGAATVSTVNSEAFWSRRLGEVKPDEVFFHRYFSDVGPRRKATLERRTGVKDDKKRKRGDGAEWDEDLGANEDEISKALAGSRPELEDGGVSDSDESANEEDEDALAEEMADGSDASNVGIDDDEGVELNFESDLEDEDDVDAADLEGEEGFSDTGSFNLGDGEDDLVGTEDESDGLAETQAVEKAGDKSKHKKKKRKLADLPTFASADDYAKIIEEGDDDDQDGR